MSWNKMKSKMGFFGLMRSFDSAESSFEKIPGGGLKATIHHALLNNVKIKHLVWWFENIDGVTTYNGQDFNGLEVDRLSSLASLRSYKSSLEEKVTQSTRKDFTGFCDKDKGNIWWLFD